MREIKFRGQISRGLANAGQWVYWGLAGTDLIDCIDMDTVGQFTGLKDKSGKEIYEKDIVRAHYFWFDGNHDADGECVGVIEMCDFTWGISFTEKGEMFFMPFTSTSHFEEPCIESLGNIYENPDLTKQPPFDDSLSFRD